MNNIIKQLAEQAETKETGYYFFDREKFAKLIVRECAAQVESKADRWGNMTDNIINQCILDCAHDLKQHFGVRE